MKDQSVIPVIENLINPKSIAIIGASETTMYGKGILESLRKNDYRGKLFPINPKRDQILSAKCFKDLKGIEEPVDLAIIIVGRKYVLNSLEECIAKNVKGALIITAGFAEADEEGKNLEKSIKKFALEHNFPIWGPNCAGFANFKDGVIATLLREEGREPLQGKAGFVSQSGALMMSLVGVARDKGLGLNYAISTGNEANLESTDFMEYMLEDPSNKVITAFVEGFKDVKHFIRVADIALEKGKPLCILKVGRSKLGEKAAASHTGSITGSDVGYETIFKQKGVIRAIDTDELLEIAKVCSMVKWPKSDGIAIITSSGGTGSLSADLCADYNLNLADMSQETVKKLVGLEELLTFETLSNPIDVRGQGIRSLDKVLPIVLKDDNYGIVLITICFSAVGKVANNVATGVRDAILNLNSDKPIFVLWVGRKQRFGGTFDIEEGFEILEKAEIPVFSEPQKCFKAIRNIINFTKAREEYFENRKRVAIFKPIARIKEMGQIISDGKKILTEYESKRILSLYDIPVTKEKLTTSPEQAIKVAEEIGYPISLKVMSPQILHKTDAGVIELNIDNPLKLKKAYDTLLKNAKNYNEDVQIMGILVQEMVSPGVEVILGMKKDPQFGPLIMFGLGGIFVEIFKDVSFRLPPIFEEDAYEMIQRIKGYEVLKGARGKRECDLQALADVIVKFSQLCIDASEVYTEIDINPLIVSEKGSGVKVVDSLMIKQ